ncbi:MAG: Holliday junction branch migration DNA helicase RuvB [Candidatus Marinimicrobia bacterium]|nr:Holliday junction branch migration DNA helicase RuvB [Candidatus Neomarinimicrobiota bacterium]
MSLFEHGRKVQAERDAPLADRMRPRSFDEFVGQDQIVDPERVLLKSLAAGRLPSIILWGPPGTGKTTLARLVATATQADFQAVSAVTSGVADLRRIVAEARDRKGMHQQATILFVDEIHRMNSSVEEYLYSAMEDYRIDIMLDKGPNSRTIQLSLEPFTLVGATTRMGNLTSPLRERFGVILRLDFYTAANLKEIIVRSAELLEITIDDDAADQFARRSRGTPRIANRILRRARDFAEVEGSGHLDLNMARQALERLGIDETGLDEMDRRILTCLVKTFGGGPVGVESLAVALHETSRTIEEVYEPYLIKEGFLQRGQRGRVALERAYSYLNVEPPLKDKASQRRLF